MSKITRYQREITITASLQFKKGRPHSLLDSRT